jgi:hypothetical protein
MGVGNHRHAPAALHQGKKHGAHFIGDSMGPRAGLDGCVKSRPHRDSIPGPSNVVMSIVFDSEQHFAHSGVSPYLCHLTASNVTLIMATKSGNRGSILARGR